MLLVTRAQNNLLGEFHYNYIVLLSHFSNIWGCLDQLHCNIHKYIFIVKSYAWLTLVYFIINSLYMVMSDFRKIWSVSGFKMAAPIDQVQPIHQNFELDYLICGWSCSYFDIVYYLYDYICISPEDLKWKRTRMRLLR